MWTVARRYNQFRELHVNMKRKYAIEMKNLKLEFPEKQFFGRFSKKLVEERRQLLEEYIKVLAGNQATRKDAVLSAFLGADEQSAPVKQSPRASIMYSPRRETVFQQFKSSPHLGQVLDEEARAAMMAASSSAPTTTQSLSPAGDSATSTSTTAAAATSSTTSSSSPLVSSASSSSVVTTTEQGLGGVTQACMHLPSSSFQAPSSDTTKSPRPHSYAASTSRSIASTSSSSDPRQRRFTRILENQGKWRDSNAGYNFDNASNRLLAGGLKPEQSGSKHVRPTEDGRLSVSRMSVLLSGQQRGVLNRELDLEAERERRLSMHKRGRASIHPSQRGPAPLPPSAASASASSSTSPTISNTNSSSSSPASDNATEPPPSASTSKVSFPATTTPSSSTPSSTSSSSSSSTTPGTTTSTEAIASTASASSSFSSSSVSPRAAFGLRPEDEFVFVDPDGDWVVEDESESSVLNAHDMFLMYRENDIYVYNTDFVRDPDPRESDPSHRLVESDFLPHINFFADMSSEMGGLVLGSIRRTPDPSGYRVLLRTAEEDESFWLTESELKGKALKKFRNQNKLIRGSTFVEACAKKLHNLSGFRRVKKQPDFPGKLAELEHLLKIQAYKFAIVYAREGQTTADQILDNELHDMPPDRAELFNRFLSMMGERIPLNGWTGYRGDLDVNGDTTGTHSIYTEWKDRPVMFQVVPWITEHASRRTKTGNDICVIIYQDGGSFYAPLIPSTVIHNYVVVKALPGKERFRIAAVSHVGVPDFSPIVPKHYEFELGSSMREFLLHKLVNGERSAHFCKMGIGSARFSLNDHRLATRKGHLEYLHSEHMPSSSPLQPTSS
eukprot:CAMPEP_0174247622 /NCGR_PEP_ID=MMETSP0417-20130205/42667_1 /TAXON_ID=242541 /ORGANISM="Mayorella sp, Strain BSH-02190019" /LENGTH=840 /DNA_ID=CAMNT_0015327481 /DNA_START=93 /DNA_END=2615 /DNA_ORIENTATION=+